MSKKQRKPSRFVRLDQLTTKEGFLRICRLDQRMSIKLDINMEFLEAAENEGFIKSIGNAPGTIKEKDGKSKEVIAPYYSPFQIYIVACLALNSSIIANVWKGGVQDVKFKTSSRSSQDGTKSPGSNNQLESERTFSEEKVIPFQFTVKMPPPRYYPMILKRDEKGRIVSSKFPELNLKFL